MYRKAYKRSLSLNSYLPLLFTVTQSDWIKIAPPKIGGQYHSWQTEAELVKRSLFFQHTLPKSASQRGMHTANEWVNLHSNNLFALLSGLSAL